MIRFSTPGRQRLSQAMPGLMDVSFAGAEATVAANFATFGGKARFLTALPKNELGEACEASLKARGVDTSGICWSEQGRLGTFFYESGAGPRPGKVIYDRAGSTFSSTPGSTYSWNSALEDSDWLVVSGITPAVSECAKGAALQAIQHARALGVKIALDINFRSKLWNWKEGMEPHALASSILPEFASLANLLIGGPADVPLLTSGQSPGDAQEAFQVLAESFPNLDLIATSVRSDGTYGGAILETENGQFSHAKTYQPGEVVDRLGAGDAFLAALLYSLTTGESPSSAIDFAAAAGCLAHSIKGDFSLLSNEEIRRFQTVGPSSQRVSR